MITKCRFFHRIFSIFQKVPALIKQIGRSKQVFFAFPITLKKRLVFWHHFILIRICAAKVGFNKLKNVVRILLVLKILRSQTSFILFISTNNIYIFELIDVLKRIHLTILIFDTCLLRLIEMFVEYTLVAVLHIGPLLLIHLWKDNIYLLDFFLSLLVLLISTWSLLDLLLKCPFAFFLLLFTHIFQLCFGSKLVTMVFFRSKKIAVICISCCFIVHWSKVLFLQRLDFILFSLLPIQTSTCDILALPFFNNVVIAFVFDEILKMSETAAHLHFIWLMAVWVSKFPSRRFVKFYTVISFKIWFGATLIASLSVKVSLFSSFKHILLGKRLVAMLIKCLFKLLELLLFYFAFYRLDILPESYLEIGEF